MYNLSRFVQTIWIFFLFMGCTLLFYYGILWVSDEYKEYHRYDEPQGKAVKVFQPSLRENPGENVYLFDRFLLFISEGE
ncbi:YqzK family protein [Salipaludibacillus sp. CUR1]|uniref:YqzK family protein n=1 Tax=Salipaludibacillus sp. CUR1 TaxID=2820003 RepID=UPI001E61814F|nr:YqzK family protein [Salipaludibacillus sp. CUR1]MCE7791096.1 YqzK family protein [Salipaludibacillus sp. CUR1]